MQTDLNDLAYFAAVVSHGGFAAAARALREPKSKLSRRVACLEERLGLRLIERSSRRFRVTETGEAFYQRCRAMLAEAEQAEALVRHAQSEPHGRIRFSCPTGMVAPVSGPIASFLARYPKVRVQLVATDRPGTARAGRSCQGRRAYRALDRAIHPHPCGQSASRERSPLARATREHADSVDQ